MLKRMADNFTSYNRFTTLPPNIADFGASVEEFKLQRGTPDKNPAISPMAVPRASLRKLALAPRGSDRARLGELEDPDNDPFAGSRPPLSLLRAALSKMNGEALGALEARLGEPGEVASHLREPMRQSCRRVALLAQAMRQTYELMNNVQARAVAVQRN